MPPGAQGGLRRSHRAVCRSGWLGDFRERERRTARDRPQPPPFQKVPFRVYISRYIHMPPDRATPPRRPTGSRSCSRWRIRISTDWASCTRCSNERAAACACGRRCCTATSRVWLTTELVTEIDAPPSASPEGGRPRYYRVTALGRRACAAEAQRLAGFVDAARQKKLLKA